MLFMKEKAVKAASTVARFKALLCMVLLLGAVGCASLHNVVSGKSWSQTAAKEEQEQLLSTSPEGDGIPTW